MASPVTVKEGTLSVSVCLATVEIEETFLKSISDAFCSFVKLIQFLEESFKIGDFDLFILFFLTNLDFDRFVQRWRGTWKRDWLRQHRTRTLWQSHRRRRLRRRLPQLRRWCFRAPANGSIRRERRSM